MNNKDYHARTEISNSRLSRFISSPRNFERPLKQTPALRWGSLVHSALLEPAVFATSVAVMPEGLDSGKGAKARVEEFETANAGREVIDHKESGQLASIVKRVMEDDIAGDLLGSPGKTEESLFFTDEDTGIPLRCRIDFWRNDGIVVDVKTTTDCGSFSFGRSVLDWGYDRQAALYWDGITAATGTAPLSFIFLAIEGKEPDEIFVQSHYIEPADLAKGRERYKAGLRDLKACRKKYGMDSSLYPYALTTEIKPLRIPYHFLNS